MCYCLNYFPEKAQRNVYALLIGQNCRKWSPWCLDGSRPTRSCLVSSTKKLGAVAQEGTVSKSQCWRCSLPIHRASSTHAKLPQLQNGMRKSMCAFGPAMCWHNLSENPRIASAEFGESSETWVLPESGWRRNMKFRTAGTRPGTTVV